MSRIRTEIPGPKSKALLERRRDYVARGVGNTGQFFVEKAKGAVITDVDGNEFIDFACGIGVTNIGHCPDEVIAAVKEQLENMRFFLHMTAHMY